MADAGMHDHEGFSTVEHEHGPSCCEHCEEMRARLAVLENPPLPEPVVVIPEPEPVTEPEVVVIVSDPEPDPEVVVDEPVEPPPHRDPPKSEPKKSMWPV